MKRNLFPTFLVLVIGLLATAALAQDDGEDPGETEGPGQGHGVCQFIDEDGDGFNDLAPDADGDGIPNGLDPDFVKPEDGAGLQYGWGMGDEEFGHFGEGAGDGAGDGEMGMNHYGPGDGTGETGPNEDHTGFGPGEAIGEGEGEGGNDDSGSGDHDDRGGMGGGGRH